MSTISKSTLIPLGIAVASMLCMGGLLWKVATWTTKTDIRLATIEMKLDSLIDGRNYLTISE